LLMAVAVAALVPAEWQIRTGLHWLVEHFLAFFSVTFLFCLAWRRPMRVAAAMLALALAIEALQALTPDRIADPATALMAAAGVASAALFADLLLALSKKSAAPGPKPSRGAAGAAFANVMYPSPHEQR
jgi:hypothetical protein